MSTPIASVFVSLVQILGKWGILAGLVVPVVLWILFGMYADFQDERERQDWLWSGLMVGTILLVMYALYNVPGL